ncbi:MAG: class I SAM-dependent methyltransferase [Myxococcota bacterium]
MADNYLPFDWYATPHYYDIVFDTTTTSEGQFLLGCYERYAAGGPATGRTLEVACGTGRLMGYLAEAGWHADGFDQSEGMLTHARRRMRAHPSRLWRDDMQTFRTADRYDLVFSLLSSFKYLLTEEQARAHLECVARALRPGGIFVLGVHTSEYGYRARTRERWVGQREGLRVTCNLQAWPADRSTRREAVRSRLIVEHLGKAEQTQRYETHWQFRTYDEHELSATLGAAPNLDLVATHGFDHNLEHTHSLLYGDRLDHVLVLRRATES